MPIYNGERFLRRTLDSLIQQSFRDFEVIVVNDASPDHSRELVASYDDDRIRLIDNPQNLGQTGSLQVAMQNAHGEYLARQDQDDVSLPDRFARQVAFLDEHPEYGVLGTNYCVINDQDAIVEGTSPAYPCETLSEMAWRLVWTDRLVDSSVMFRRKDAQEVGGYNLKYRYAQDYDLWVRLSFETGVARLSEVLLQLRVHGGNASNLFAASQEHEVYDILRESLNKLLEVPISRETAEMVSCVDNAPNGQSRADVTQAVKIIRDTYESFCRKRSLRGRELKAVSRALAEKLAKLAIRHRESLHFETLNLLFTAWSYYPSLVMEPDTLVAWWRQMRQAQRFRQVVSELWID
jgi:glycosyltransferase involved in cell wall biosynthesis